MRISDWSSDVCSSDLGQLNFLKAGIRYADLITVVSRNYAREILTPKFGCGLEGILTERSEEHTSELQSLMRISYAVFCLKKKKIKTQMRHNYCRAIKLYQETPTEFE